MKIKQTLFVPLIAAALALSACGQAATSEAMPAAGTTASETMVEKAAPTVEAMAEEKPTADAMMGEKPTAGAMMDEQPTAEATMDETPAGDAMVDEQPTADAMMDMPAVELPAWFSASLMDVNSGQRFTVADHQGKVVLVETLAVWCSNCLKQQKQVQALHEALGQRDDFVSIGLDIDLNESADQLRNHAQRNGFDWVYAVATPDVARAISDLYGVNFLNPPSTPMLIIDRAGQAHPLPFGIKSAADLQAALEPFLSEGL